MAEYTIELHDAIDNFIPPETLFDFDYTLHDPLHKPVLEQLIINHYYYREIGFETIDRFKRYLSATLNEILPKYNIMYEQLETDLVMLSNNSTENIASASGTNSTINNGTTESESDGTAGNTNLALHTDTPQSAVDFTAPSANVTDMKKTTDAATNSSTASVTDSSTGSGTNTNEANSTLKGYTGITESELRAIYFDNIVIVDNMIIKDLNELFMKIY